MTTSFTPGPWRWSGEWSTLRGICSIGGGYVGVEAPREVEVEAWHANVNLIAAAPDLYAALEALMRMQVGEHHADARLEAEWAATAALKKAMGE